MVLVSGNGTNLQAILDACADGSLPAEVVAVVCDKSNAYALQRAALPESRQSTSASMKVNPAPTTTPD